MSYHANMLYKSFKEKSTNLYYRDSTNICYTISDMYWDNEKLIVEFYVYSDSNEIITVAFDDLDLSFFRCASSRKHEFCERKPCVNQSLKLI